MNFESLWKHQQDISLSDSILPESVDFVSIYGEWKAALAEHASAGILESKSAYRQNQWQSPATAHYFDVNWEPWEHPGDALPYTVELARVLIPRGSIGVVRLLNQWVSGDFTTSTNWGNPFTGTDVDDYIWSLRLVPFDGQQAPRLISAQQFMPGYSYPDLPQWRYLLYLPHNAGQEVNLVVPGGYSLELFVRTTALETRDEVWGRLAGYWQSSEYAVESGFNARKGF